MSSTEETAYDIWWDYVCEFRDAVEGSAGWVDDDVVQGKLPQDDWFLYLVSNVIGLMANTGSFVTALGGFAGYQADLEMALSRFGFPASAANVQASIDYCRECDLSGTWTQEFDEHHNLIEEKCIDERHNRIEEQCDWSYTQLIEYLRCHDNDFSHSILPYCERRGWQGHGSQG